MPGAPGGPLPGAVTGIVGCAAHRAGTGLLAGATGRFRQPDVTPRLTLKTARKHGAAVLGTDRTDEHIGRVCKPGPMVRAGSRERHPAGPVQYGVWASSPRFSACACDRGSANLGSR